MGDKGLPDHVDARHHTPVTHTPDHSYAARAHLLVSRGQVCPREAYSASSSGATT